MTIDELNALTTLTAADEVPVWDSEESGEPTKKITASNLAASVKSLASLPNTTEMNTAIQQSTANIAIKRTVTASNFTQGNTKWVTCPGVSGYTPVGIVGLRSPQDATGLTKLYYWDLSNPGGIWQVRFVANATFDKTIEADVLYIKD